MTSYDWTKTYLNESEVRELHELIGAALETGDLTGLPRAREIASLLLSDFTAEG